MIYIYIHSFFLIKAYQTTIERLERDLKQARASVSHPNARITLLLV